MANLQTVFPQYYPVPEVLFTKLDEAEGVLLHLETQQYYSLNETGIAVWEAVQNEHTLEQLLAGLGERYEFGRLEAVQFITAFLEELRAEGLITADGPVI